MSRLALHRGGGRWRLVRDCIAATAACHGRRLLAAVRLPAYCYCDMRGFLLLYRSLRLYI